MGYPTRQEHQPRSSNICLYKVRASALMTYVSKRLTPILNGCQDVDSLRTYTSKEHCQLSTTLELRVLGCRILRLSIERTNFLTARSKAALCFPPIAGLNSNNSFSTSSQATGSVTWLKDRLWYCVVLHFQPMLSKNSLARRFDSDISRLRHTQRMSEQSSSRALWAFAGKV